MYYRIVPQKWFNRHRQETYKEMSDVMEAFVCLFGVDRGDHQDELRQWVRLVWCPIIEKGISIAHVDANRRTGDKPLSAPQFLPDRLSSITTAPNDFITTPTDAPIADTADFNAEGTIAAAPSVLPRENVSSQILICRMEALSVENLIKEVQASLDVAMESMDALDKEIPESVEGNGATLGETQSRTLKGKQKESELPAFTLTAI
jgi:hypothetical protein